MLYLAPVLARRRGSDSSNNNVAELERAFLAHLLNHHISMQPGLPAFCPRAGWYRATFSREQNYMREALSRLDRALDSW